MKRVVFALALLCTALCSPAYAAADVRGVKFADTVEVGSQALLLNGAGVRVKLLFDVYAASLYLPQRHTTAQAVLEQSGPKTIHAVLLRDLSADDFVGAMIKGFKANNSEAEQTRHHSRLEALEAMMRSGGSARKGTVIHIDFVPGSGTRITIDGLQRGPFIPGEDFYQALLRIWLGPKPVDADLKSALLNSGT
jgi:Chalcone isomerase-like